MADRSDTREEIAVTTDQDSCVESVFNPKSEQSDRNIHIGLLFLKSCVLLPAPRTSFVNSAEFTIRDRHPARHQCFDVQLMALHFFLIPIGKSSEVVDFFNMLILSAD